jgi:hypothetical protein
MKSEKRRHPRYPISGSAVFRTAKATESEGELMDLGMGGLCICTAVAPTPGTSLWVCFNPRTSPERLMARGRIAHVAQGTIGVEFLERPAQLEELLGHLGQVI